MDDIHEDNVRMHMSEAQHPMQFQYEHHGLHHMSNGNVNGMDDNHYHDNGNVNGSGGGGNEGYEGDVPSDAGNLSDNRSAMVEQVGGDSGDQLTLSFQGQVYVFDSVSPEKVFYLSSLFSSCRYFAFYAWWSDILDLVFIIWCGICAINMVKNMLKVSIEGDYVQILCI